jgi:hypothetical protein
VISDPGRGYQTIRHEARVVGTVPPAKIRCRPSASCSFILVANAYLVGNPGSPSLKKLATTKIVFYWFYFSSVT